MVKKTFQTKKLGARDEKAKDILKILIKVK
jgi:hypothetical protein